jgi:hypothetical protein
MNCSPICLFTYNRLAETKQTVAALKENFLAFESELFIFSDGWKNENTKIEVLAVRDFLRSISGFRNIKIIEREKNFGLAKSIISGVTEIIDKYGRVIVLEDDLITSKNFLSYMNEGLSFYKENQEVWSISGFSFPITYPENYEFDTALGLRSSSWGWATWADRWGKVDWDVSDYEVFLKDRKKQKEFNLGGSDLCKMLNDQMAGKINSWAIRFCYSQFKNKTFDVFPKITKVKNIGFSDEATHTASMGSRFDTILDETNRVDFEFPERIVIEPRILRQFQKPFSVQTRIKYKLLGYLK